MEARIRDGGTGEVICMCADRENAKFAPVNLPQYTWYRPATNIIHEWADQFVELSNSTDPIKIEDSRPFTLKPW
jgi:hypothetical protein